jgi:hypothetical protein
MGWRAMRLMGGRGVGNDLGTTNDYLRRTTSGAAGNGLGTKVKYFRRTASGAAGNGQAQR